jgi:hypothetical protein
MQKQWLAAMACANAKEHGVRKLKMETDCQVLVRLWSERAIQKSEIAALLQQMEDLSWSFEAFDLMFIPRNCNRLAHECAHLVSNEHKVVEWLVTHLG